MKQALYSPDKETIDLDKIPEGYRELAKGLVYYVQSVHEASVLAADIARGELDTNPLTTDSEVAPGLKSLQATLRHLTWQTQQIAKGDYKQRVSFMGDFSEAMNNMVIQLDERQKALEAEIDEGIRKSDALALNLKVLEEITRQMSQLVMVVDKDSKEVLFQNHPIERTLHDRSSVSQLYAWLGEQLNEDHISAATKDLELIYNGGFQFFTADIRPLAWGKRAAKVFVFTDTTSTRRALASLEEIANYDPQTGVHSRHYGMQVLNKWASEKQTFALCFVDMDKLKYVNDTFGHAEGDKYILEVSGILRSFAPDAFVCRLGGDEFMLLAPGMAQQAAEDRLETLRDELMAKGEIFEPRYKHSLSYGVLSVDAGTTQSVSELLGLADERMYRYKKATKATRQV